MAFERLAGGNPGGLRCEPGECCGFAGSRVELGAVKVNAGSTTGGVEQQAGGGTRMVGDAGAVVERERRGSAVGPRGIHRGIRVAGEDHGKAAGGEKGPEALIDLPLPKIPYVSTLGVHLDPPLNAWTSRSTNADKS